MKTTAIELSNVTKRFGSLTAVDNLSIRIEPGEIVALLGPNGAGKTTTLDMILGLSKPSEGSVAVYGGTPREAIDRGRIGAVLQTGSLFNDISVRDNLRMIAAVLPHHTPIEEVLERAGLSTLANRRVNKCSGGEQQRLRYAISILTNPDLLILDEPTTGMDVNARAEFWAKMRLEAKSGKTIMFATHYLKEAQDFAERIVIIKRGQVIKDGSLAEIQASAQTVIGFEVPSMEEGKQVAAQIATRYPVASMAETQEGWSVRLPNTLSDEVARMLLNETPAQSLTVTREDLDQIFTELTVD